VGFNEYVYVLPMETRTSAVTSPVQVNKGFKGVKLTLFVATISGDIGMHLNGVDRLSGQQYYLLSSSSVSASGVTNLTVYPGITTQANVALSTVLPYDWSVTVAPVGSAEARYSVGASLIE